jgi:hypothetical protein
MVQWITLSTHSGGVVNSGDRGLTSPAKQTSIPCSGSFTEVCSVVSEGRTGLGGHGHAVHGQTTVSLSSGEVECVRRGVVDA